MKNISIIIPFQVAQDQVKQITLKNLSEQIHFYADNTEALEELKRELIYARMELDVLLERNYQKGVRS